MKTTRISAVPSALLPLLGRQHAGHGLGHIVDRVVDDVVVAQVHAVAFGQLAGVGVGTDVEADDDGLGGERQVDVDSLMPPTAAWTICTLTSSVGA